MLSNKIIIITGASRGIGLNVAKECSINGATLVIIARHSKELKRAISQLKGHNVYYRLDVGNIKAVEYFFRFIKDEYESIDGLVNCAGDFGPIGRTHDVEPKDFKQTLNNNLVGTFNMCHFGIPLLIKKHHGKIINFSGGGATGPFPNYSAYACSKIGIVKLTENICKEYYNEKLDVNVIAPGFVKTRLAQKTIQAGENAGNFYNRTKKMIQHGGVPPKFASDLIVFLLSGLSNGISGKIISASWDNWKEKKFQEKLKTDHDFATIRRIDNKYFKGINE